MSAGVVARSDWSFGAREHAVRARMSAQLGLRRLFSVKSSRKKAFLGWFLGSLAGGNALFSSTSWVRTRILTVSISGSRGVSFGVSIL
jgi:hypothetical protein